MCHLCNNWHDQEFNSMNKLFTVCSFQIGGNKDVNVLVMRYMYKDNNVRHALIYIIASNTHNSAISQRLMCDAARTIIAIIWCSPSSFWMKLVKFYHNRLGVSHLCQNAKSATGQTAEDYRSNILILHYRINSIENSIGNFITYTKPHDI
jgi:hypothetical protein